MVKINDKIVKSSLPPTLPPLDRTDLRSVIIHRNSLISTATEHQNLVRFCRELQTIAQVPIGRNLLDRITKIGRKVILSLNENSSWEVFVRPEGLEDSGAARLQGSFTKRCYNMISTPAGNVLKETPFHVMIFHELGHLYHYYLNPTEQARLSRTTPPKGRFEFTNKEEDRTITLENIYRDVVGLETRVSHQGLEGAEFIRLDKTLKSPVQNNPESEERLLEDMVEKGLSSYLYNRIRTQDYLRKSGLGAEGFLKILPDIFSSWDGYATEKAKMLAACITLLKKEQQFIVFDNFLQNKVLWSTFFDYAVEKGDLLEFHILSSSLTQQEKFKLLCYHFLPYMAAYNKFDGFFEVASFILSKEKNAYKWMFATDAFAVCLDRAETRNFLRKKVPLKAFVDYYRFHLLSENLGSQNKIVFEQALSNLKKDPEFLTELCKSTGLVEEIRLMYSNKAEEILTYVFKSFEKVIPEEIFTQSILYKELSKTSKSPPLTPSASGLQVT